MLFALLARPNKVVETVDQDAVKFLSLTIESGTLIVAPYDGTGHHKPSP